MNDPRCTVYNKIIQCTSVKIVHCTGMPNGDMLLLMNKAKPETRKASETRHTPGLIWAREPRRNQDQHPPLSREQIVRAAIEIADAEGIQALSIRRMAAKLGVSTMALYWYVESKEDVLDLMVDAVYAEMAFSQPSSGSWRTDCMMLATQV